MRQLPRIVYRRVRLIQCFDFDKGTASSRAILKMLNPAGAPAARFPCNEMNAMRKTLRSASRGVNGKKAPADPRHAPCHRSRR
jgi:hypothetical protein